jgi:hypothetical protein
MLADKRICLAEAASSKEVFSQIWQWEKRTKVLLVVTLWTLEFLELDKCS